VSVGGSLVDSEDYIEGRVFIKNFRKYLMLYHCGTWSFRINPSSLSIRMGYGQDGRGSIRVRDKIFFSFPQRFRPFLGPAQPHIQGVPGTLLLGVKLLGREADHSPPSTSPIDVHGVVLN
jgi:hypothetical protein